MKAMVLKEICEIAVKDKDKKYIHLPLKDAPLEMVDHPDPVPGHKEILIKISACGVCHTELDEIEGRLTPSFFPIILGHEVVGKVAAKGPGATRFKENDRVGVAWIYTACGECRFCKGGFENLCEQFQATGRDANGGYAQYMVVSEAFAYPIPDTFSDSQAAPLLCAGVIGYRALRLSGVRPGDTLGLYGFGASAHIAIQVAKYWSCEVFVFSRKGAKGHRSLAERLGANWVGATEDTPPQPLDCAIDYTPVGEPVRQALKNLRKGGRVVINAIRKLDPIPELEYTTHVWHEKELKSVANITRQDALEFLPLASEIGIMLAIQEFDLGEANRVLTLLKEGNIQGAGVLRIP